MDPEKPKQFELLSEGGTGPWEEPELASRADFQALAVASGHEFKNTAMQFVQRAGGTPIRVGFNIDGVPVDGHFRGSTGCEFLILARGTPDDHLRSGLRKDD